MTSADRPSVVLPTSAVPLVVAAHGSEDPGAAETVVAILRQLAVAHAGPVFGGWLDLLSPSLAAVLPEAAAAADGPVLVLPLLLSAGFHVSRDIPDVVRGSGVPASVARHLGPDPLLAAAGRERLAEVGVHPDDDRWGVVLAAVGSSDPAAATEVAAAAELLGEGTSWRTAPGYATTSPSVSDAAASLRAAGATRIALSPYVIAPGKLPHLIARTPADAVAEPLGAHPLLVRVALARIAAALGQDRPLDLEGARA